VRVKNTFRQKQNRLLTSRVMHSIQLGNVILIAESFDLLFHAIVSLLVFNGRHAL
jgi:hypothetical protein